MLSEKGRVLHVDCHCIHPGHTLRFVQFHENPEIEVYVDYHLETGGFCSRLWKGIKYILGFDSTGVGQFGEAIWDTEAIDAVREFLSDAVLTNGCKRIRYGGDEDFGSEASVHLVEMVNELLTRDGIESESFTIGIEVFYLEEEETHDPELN